MDSGSSLVLSLTSWYISTLNMALNFFLKRQAQNKELSGSHLFVMEKDVHSIMTIIK